MGKLLRVLVVILLVLSITSVVFSVLLFMKREELIGRTKKLESTVIQLAGTLEAEEATVEVQPTYPQRDVSDVTSLELMNPNLSEFWKGYDSALEVVDTIMLDYSTQDMRLQLRKYYATDTEGRKLKDPVNSKYRTDGPTTMQELIDRILKRATQQHANLNTTRSQLTKVRVELGDTITELNGEKSLRRTNLADIKAKRQQIAGLESDKSRLENTVTTLNDNIEQLNGEVTDLNTVITQRDEDIAAQQAMIASQKKRIDELINPDIHTPPPRDGAVAGDWADRVAPGVKGKVVSVDDNWNFVVVKLDDRFLSELLGEDLGGPMPMIDLNVKRAGFTSPAGDFVTKVRLRHLKREEGLAIADVLLDWEQVKVKQGDDIWF